MIKKIYERLPLFAQHLAITVVNNYKYYQKYGAIPFFKPLKKVITNLENQELNDQNTVDRINSLIEYATKYVPYYIENKDKYHSITSIEEIKKIPILDKETFRKYNTNFHSNEVNSKKSYAYNTSGSTGTPLKGFTSIDDLRKRFACFLISLEKENIDYSLKVARFLGAKVSSGKKVYRKDYINNHYLFSIYDLSLSNIEVYHEAISNNKIEILEGYPSTIYSLIKLLKLKKLKLSSVKHVLTTAEKLLDYQKTEIEEYLGVKIFDYYGSSEGSAYMYKCSSDFYTNANKVAYFETVDENYEDIPKSTSGRMLITSFSTYFTPLIRYDIGDFCSIISEKDEVIKVSEINGRQDDVFITPNGIEFSRFSLILKYLPDDILESQLILKNFSDNVELLYVSNVELSKDNFKIFEQKMTTFLKLKFNYKYTQVEGFDKIKRGKLSAIKIIKNED